MKIEEIYKLVYHAYYLFKPYRWDRNEVYEKEDFIQEGVLSVLSNLEKYNPKYKYSTFVNSYTRWAWSTMRQKTTTLKRGSNERYISLDQFEQFDKLGSLAEDIRKNGGVEGEIIIDEIKSAVVTSKRDREVLEVMLGNSGKTYTDLARKYGVSSQAITNVKEKIKDKIRKILEEE